MTAVHSPSAVSRPREDPYRLALSVTLALAIGLRCYLLFAARATEEDFYITLRYAENLAFGRGWVYNPGRYVLGTTTPLYTLLLALLIEMHLNPVLAGAWIGIASDVVTCVCVYRLGRAAGAPGAGVAAALCLAIAPTNLIWATKGMEAGLVAAVVALAWMAWAEGRERLAWGAAGLLLLLRLDGFALAMVLLAATWLWEKRVPWRGLAVFALLTLPWLLFAAWRFGSPIPSSLRAKLIVYSWHAPPGFPNLLPFCARMTHNPFSAALAVGALCFVLSAVRTLRSYLPRRVRQRHPPETGRSERPALLASPRARLLPPFCWMLLHYGGMALSKVYLFGWYFVPPTPIYYLIAGFGWMAVGSAFGGGRVVQRRAGWLAAMTAAAGALLSAATVPTVARTLRAGQRVEETLRIPIGQWLQAHAAPTDTVMLEPIGYIGYYSGLRVLDTVGLVSPEVLPYYRAEVASPLHALWMHFRPEWVLLRAGEWEALRAYEADLPREERLEAWYRPTAMGIEARRGAAPAFFLFRQTR